MKKGKSKKPAIVSAPPETTEKLLTPKEELFCIYITRPRTDTFGNRTLAYAEAFDYQLDSLSKVKKKVKGKKRSSSAYDRTYAICAVEGGKLFKRPYIHAKIEVKLNELYGSESAINAHLANIAYQEKDLSVSLSAMRDINKLRRRLGANSADPDEEYGDSQPINSLQIIMPPGTKIKTK